MPQKKYILFIAILISIVAEYFSIYGTSKLFSGSYYSIIVMGIIFAIGKLVIATILKLYWNSVSKPLRYYLTFALILLSIFTSVGIYGFLSDSYIQTKTKDDYVQVNINLVKKKKEHFEGSNADLKLQLNQVNSSIEKLRNSISTDNQTQQVVNGKVITNIVSSSKKGVQDQLDKALHEKETLDSKVSSNNDSIGKLELKIIEVEQSSDVASELGPLKYISKLSGVDMDSVVNYMIFLIILIFDPLALALVWVYFTPIQKEPKIIQEEVKNDPIVPIVEELVLPVKRKRGRPKKTEHVNVNDLIDSIMKPEKPKRKRKVVGLNPPDVNVPPVEENKKKV